MEGHSGWGINSMPRSRPTQHDRERRCTPSTHPFILTRRICKKDYDGQMIFAELVYLKLPGICLTDEEKHRKKSHPGNLSRPRIEPGPAAWQERMLPPAPQRWTIIQSVRKFLLQTSRACRGDWVDNFLKRNPCPETYHFHFSGTTSSK